MVKVPARANTLFSNTDLNRSWYSHLWLLFFFGFSFGCGILKEKLLQKTDSTKRKRVIFDTSHRIQIILSLILDVRVVLFKHTRLYSSV